MESENIRMGLRKIWSVILLLGILICPAHVWGREALTLSETHVENHQSDSKEQPVIPLHAKAAVLMDADSGRVLYDKNGEEALPMASTTKIMTLILTLECADLEDVVEVSSYAASMPEVKLHIRQGEKYRLKDLLYSLMLESHNDSAVAIAEHVGGCVEAFADMMNEKARQIGCENTCFVTPNGLDATAEYIMEDGSKVTKEHTTTATDLARILSYCITRSPKREQFLEITRTPAYAFGDIDHKRNFRCNNHNAFLTMMDGALTGKTGFTGKAGYCYTGALKKDDRTYVVALLACGWPNHKTYKWSDTRALMEYGLSSYQYHDLMQESVPQEALAAVRVCNGQTSQIGETAYMQIEVKEDEHSTEGILMREDEWVDVRVIKQQELMAPVSKGEVIGEVGYFVGDEEWRHIELTAAQDIMAVDLNWRFKQVLRKWLI